MTWFFWCILVGIVVIGVIGAVAFHKGENEPEPVETEWERQMRELNKAFNQMFISCGNALRPPLEGFAKDLATLFNAIAESLESGSENES